MMNISIITIIVFGFIPSVFSLECYVCLNQDSNMDKCIKTVKTCQSDENRCLSKVRWGSTPYWAPSGEKQYYISKSCATDVTCMETIKNHSSRCDRIWYNDWECAECCLGDRCNYFVTLSATCAQPNVWIFCCLFFYTWIKGFL